MHKISWFTVFALFLGWGLGAAAQSASLENKLATNSSASVNEPVKSFDVANPVPVADEFVIGIGDVLAVNVWKEAEITRVVPVRSDGRITLALIGEIEASGLTAKQLEGEVAKRLKEFVSDPEVTVIVQEIKSRNFNILGQVQHAGTFPLTHPISVLDAVALAGGFRDFAKTKSMYVLRQKSDGSWVRLPFNYKEAIKGRSPAQNLTLETGDTLVIP